MKVEFLAGTKPLTDIISPPRHEARNTLDSLSQEPERPQALKRARALLSTQELGHWALCVAGIWVAAAGIVTQRAHSGASGDTAWGDKLCHLSSTVPLVLAGTGKGRGHCHGNAQHMEFLRISDGDKEELVASCAAVT